MTTMNLEPQELSIIIRALEMLKTVHPCALCDFTLTPVIEKLRNPPPVEAPPSTRAAKLPARPTPWTEEEDAVIRKYSSMGQPVWPSMQGELPGRTLNMIKARFGRLGLLKVAEPEPQALILEHESEPTPEVVVEPEPVKPEPEPVPPRPPEPTTATTESTKGWSPRPPSLAELMSGKR